MGRFDHLEIGDWRARPDEGKPPSGMLDQDYYLTKARDAFANESYEQALSYYSRTLQYDISIEEAWLGQLRCLIELGELPEAITWSNRALEHFPQSAQILSARAVAEARLGRPATAMKYSDSAFNAQGVSAYCWTARGEILIPVNMNNAKACFSKAVEMSPTDPSVRAWIARAYLVRKHYHQALEHLNCAVRLDSEKFICWYWIGRCSATVGQITEAKIAYRRALAVCPSFRPAQDAVAQLENRRTMSKTIDIFKRLFRSHQGSEG